MLFLFQMVFVCSPETFRDPNPNVEFWKSRIRKILQIKTVIGFSRTKFKKNRLETTNEEKIILERLNELQSLLAGVKRQNEEVQLILVNETREKFNLANFARQRSLGYFFQMRLSRSEKLARWIFKSSVSSDSQGQFKAVETASIIKT